MSDESRLDDRRTSAAAGDDSGNSLTNHRAIPSSGKAESVVIPILAEVLGVDVRRVVVGGVRLRKRVVERSETIDEPLMEEQLDVERIELNQIVETAPAVRYEGDTMIVPLMEEVFVVEKRLMLREEIRIRRRETQVHKPQTVTLRKEEVDIEPLARAGDEAQAGAGEEPEA